MRRIELPFWLLLCSFLLVSEGISARAQGTSTIIEQITLPIGSVFEVMVEHDIKDPVYNWSFSKEDSFLQASREQTFRARLILTGNYTLSGEVYNINGSKRFRKQIRIRVVDQIEKDTTLSTLSGSILTATVPRRDAKGRIILGPNTDMILLTPDPSIENNIILDLDASKDSNGDKKPRNDQDAADTFFSTKRTPLYVWFTTPISDRSIAVSVKGKPGIEEILLSSAESAATKDLEEEQARRENKEILMTPFGSGTIKFALDTSGKKYISAPILIHWDFGDGTQSLLDSPLHTYAKNGAYEIKADVRNLKTGEVVDEFVSIARIDTITAPPTPTPDDADDEGTDGDETPSDDGGKFAIGSIIKFIIGAILAAIVGFILTLIVRVLRKKGGIQGALGKAEDTLVKTDDKKKKGDESVIDVPAVPMALEEDKQEVEGISTPDSGTSEPKAKQELPPAQSEPEEATPPTPSPEPEEATPPTPSPEPKEAPPTPATEQAEGEAPSWLQGGLDQAAATGQTMDSPPAPELQTGNRVSEAEPPPSVAPVSTPEPVIETPAPASVEPPAPITPAPTPVEETPIPIPTPTSTDATAPAWLQGGLEKASSSAKATEDKSEEGQTMDSPPPAELQNTPLPPAPPAQEQAPTPQVQTGELAKDWAQMTPEEREKERKRQKRRRYRQNKKVRAKQELETKSVAPAESTTPPKEEAAKQEQPILPVESDNEVKFVIGADSLNGQVDIPPAEEHIETPGETEKQE